MKVKLEPRGLFVGGIIVSVFGFAVTLVAAILPSIGIQLDILNVGLGTTGVGLGLVAIGLGWGSDQRMKAMGNSEFHEKLAMMKGYLRKPQERIEHDLQAALELKKWVSDPKLKQEFEESRQKLREFMNMKPIVIKIGGSTLGSHDTALDDLAALHKDGKALVVVHGGGQAISRWQERHGIAARFVGGLRVTDEAGLQVVMAVLAGLVNKELVAALSSKGAKAVGLSGVDGGLIQARVKDPALGLVGEVTRINLEPLNTMLQAGYLPVIAPLGFQPPESGQAGLVLNLNADTAAGQIAAALGAESLIFLSDVPGILDGSGQLLETLSPRQVKGLIDSAIISSGMLPKVEACLAALAAGVKARIVDGRLPHALTDELAGKLKGTTIVNEVKSVH